MQKKTEHGVRAFEYEHLQATEFDKPFVAREVYHVEGRAGLWRRVAMPKRTKEVPVGALLVVCGKEFIAVMKDEKMTAEMGVGGYTTALPDAPVSPMEVADDSAEAPTESEPATEPAAETSTEPGEGPSADDTPEAPE